MCYSLVMWPWTLWKHNPNLTNFSHLLSFLNSVQVNFNHIVLQSAHQQTVVVSQEETVHVSAFVHPEKQTYTLHGFYRRLVQKQYQTNFLYMYCSRVVKHHQPPTRVAFEIGLWKKQNACFKTVNVPHVICRMHLERRMTIHCWSKEWGDMTLAEKSKLRNINGYTECKPFQ